MSVILRSATTADVPALLAIYAPYVEQTAITFEYTVPTAEEFTARMENIQKQYPYLVAEEEGELLGYCYAGKFKEKDAYAWAVETTIYIKQGHKRSGIGRMLYEELERCLKEQGILNLYACIGVPPVEDEHLTMDSVRFHERMGYRLIGTFYQCGYKFNRWYDMVWMEKMIGEHKEEQKPVTAWKELAGGQ